MQNWKKLGLVYCPDGKIEWMKTHAMMPSIYHIEDDIFGVYFSPRDSNSRSRPAYLEIEIKEYKFNIRKYPIEPLLELGNQGAFDDAGIMPTCIYKVEKNDYMMFNGWCLGTSVPFYSFNGLAIKDGDKFKKLSKHPNVLNRSIHDPYSTFAPFVLLEDDNKWRMWYVSLLRWEGQKHYYNIRTATSSNGINWDINGDISIDFVSEYEYALGRPMVIKENNIYKMWFSSRATKDIDTYRIRYAESKDGINWIRKDEEVGIDVSETGWDSEMICYPFIFDHKGKRYMLYNGNGYGKTGFGLAVLEEEI